MSLPPSPDAVEPVWIDSQDSLRRHCSLWSRAEALAIDTEFVRTRTFFPRLGLIQVSDGEEHALIDPLAIPDLDPLENLLQDSGIPKVLHSCGEDLEVFHHRFGTVPQPIFDTQIGAAFATVGNSLGYSRLVQEFFSVELPKEETRSNWLKRPLTDGQMLYAALDVTYLLPLYQRLSTRLEELGRSDWMAQEIEQLSAPGRYLPDPDTAFLKLAHPAMSRPELAALQALAAWREIEARKRDLPRNFVLPKNALTEIARKRPKSAAQLEKLGILKHHELRRFADPLVRILQRTAKLSDEEMPSSLQRPRDLSAHKPQVDRFRKALAKRAEQLGLAPELIANRKMVERIWRRRLDGKTPTVPEAMTPWRQEILREVLTRLG